MAIGNLLKGKRGLITGVANERSIAWAIAKACRAEGAELAFTYAGEALERRVIPLAQQLDSPIIVPCDVSKPDELDAMFEAIENTWDRLDFVLHAIAFADREELKGRYVDTSLDNFLMTMNISCYSFTALAQRADKLMTDGGSLLTLSYQGSEKVIPHYNVMGVAKAALEASVRYLAADLGKTGVRVNALSPGAIKTLAAAGIGDFRTMLKFSEQNSPLRRNVDQEEVAKSALYLFSDLGSGVTGELIHVDAGMNVVGMGLID